MVGPGLRPILRSILDTRMFNSEEEEDAKREKKIFFFLKKSLPCVNRMEPKIKAAAFICNNS